MKGIQQVSQRNILTHIVILRTIAIILVVLGHATRNMDTPNLHLFYPEYTTWIEILIKKYIYSFHMPLFFWISGYVFYFSTNKNSKQFSISNELKKKVKRLIVPLYATSFLVLLPTMILFGNLNIPIWKQILYMLFMRGNDHLWFLQILFLIFLIVIPLSLYIKRQNTKILVFMTILIILVHINITFPISEVNMVSQYLPYFMLGFITRKVEREIGTKASLLIGLLLFIFHFVSFYVLDSFNAVEAAREYLIFFVAAIGIYSFYFLSIFLSQIGLSSLLWKNIQTIDDNSYSIYLFHVMFLYIILYINTCFTIDNSLFRIICTFVLGMLVPIYLHKYFAENKYTRFLFSIK